MRIPHNWEPRKYQLPLWTYLESGGKRGAAVWHRRSGKDDVALRWEAVGMTTKPGNYWHMLPKGEQARKAIWTAVNPHSGIRRIDEAFPKELRKRTSDKEMSIRWFNDSYWQVLGSDNYDSYVGSPPVGVVLSEWPLADAAAWAYLEPILEENGGWALFLYTPRGPNHGLNTFNFAKTQKSWFSERLTVEDTPVFNKRQLARILKGLKATYGDTLGLAYYNQEYLCSFDSPVAGAVYGELMEIARYENRILDFKHDPEYPVNTTWDLGGNNASSSGMMALWFYQLIGQDIKFIDYEEGFDAGFSYWGNLLNERAKKYGYRYGQHIGPHDIRVTEISAGKPRAQLAYEDGGIRFDAAPKPANKNDGIASVRSLFKRFHFHATKCKTGIQHLCSYHYRSNKITGGFGPPVHDLSSNGCDALQSFCLYTLGGGQRVFNWLQ